MVNDDVIWIELDQTCIPNLNTELYKSEVIIKVIVYRKTFREQTDRQLHRSKTFCHWSFHRRGGHKNMSQIKELI